MPLDAAAARAVATALVDANPRLIDAQRRTRDAAVDDWTIIVKAVFDGIKTSAVVTVAPGTMAAGGDPVTGSGTGTIT